MRQHVVSVVDTTHSRVIVRASISMESRLAIIGSEGGVRQPPRRVIELVTTFK